jgi:hypothetical protein
MPLRATKAQINTIARGIADATRPSFDFADGNEYAHPIAIRHIVIGIKNDENR